MTNAANSNMQRRKGTIRQVYSATGTAEHSRSALTRLLHVGKTNEQDGYV